MVNRLTSESLNACSTADQEGYEERREGWFSRDRERIARLDASPFHILVDDDRLACLQRDPAEAHDLDRVVDQSNATLQRIREPDHARVPIDHPDVDGLRVEDLPDALAHEVVHALHLEVLGEATLHVVDERQLCGPLPRLFEEARVLKRDAQTAGERHQQADVTIAERVLPVEVLKRDDAGRALADEERNEHG